MTTTDTDPTRVMIATQREATAMMKRQNSGASFYSFGPVTPEENARLDGTPIGFEYEGTYSFPDGTTSSFYFWHSTRTGQLLALPKIPVVKAVREMTA